MRHLQKAGLYTEGPALFTHGLIAMALLPGWTLPVLFWREPGRPPRLGAGEKKKQAVKAA